MSWANGWDVTEMYKGLNGYDGSYIDPAMVGLGGLNKKSTNSLIGDGTIGVYTKGSKDVYKAAAKAKVGEKVRIPGYNKPMLITQDLHDAGTEYMGAIDDGRLNKPNTGWNMGDTLFAASNLLGPLGGGKELLNKFAPEFLPSLSEGIGGFVDKINPFGGDVKLPMDPSFIEGIDGLENASRGINLQRLPMSPSFIEGIDSGSGMIPNAAGQLGIIPQAAGSTFTQKIADAIIPNTPGEWLGAAAAAPGIVGAVGTVGDILTGGEGETTEERPPIFPLNTFSETPPNAEYINSSPAPSGAISMPKAAFEGASPFRRSILQNALDTGKLILV